MVTFDDMLNYFLQCPDLTVAERDEITAFVRDRVFDKNPTITPTIQKFLDAIGKR